MIFGFGCVLVGFAIGGIITKAILDRSMKRED